MGDGLIGVRTEEGEDLQVLGTPLDVEQVLFELA